MKPNDRRRGGHADEPAGAVVAGRPRAYPQAPGESGPLYAPPVDSGAVRAFAAIEVRSDTSAGLVELAEAVLSVVGDQGKVEQQAREAGLELRAARAERDQVEVEGTLGESEVSAADRKRTVARIERAETTLRNADDRRRVLALARTRAEADLTRFMQEHDAPLVEELNVRVEESCHRLRDRLGEAEGEIEALRALTAEGAVHLATVGRAIYDKVADERVTLFEPRLRAVVQEAADPRLVPLVPPPRGEEQVEASMLPEVSA